MFGLQRSGCVLAMVLGTATPVWPSSRLPRDTSRRRPAPRSSCATMRRSRPGPETAVFETDTLRTGADGTVGITLKDDTRLSLGPASEVRLERYVYAPGEGGFAMVLKFARGVAAYVSGRMAKLAPDSIRLETPSAIVGVRGTTPSRFASSSDATHVTARPSALLVTIAVALAAGCAAQHVVAAEPPRPVPPALIVLLPDPETGTTGRIRVSNPLGAVDLSAPAPRRASPATPARARHHDERSGSRRGCSAPRWRPCRPPRVTSPCNSASSPTR